MKRNRRIPGLESYRRRPLNGTFDALPYHARRDAHMWLRRFCKRWGVDLPPWRYAILVGQAKRLALNPPDSAWGSRMLAKRGGLAVQEKYRREGVNPTAKATEARRSELQTNPPQRQRRAGTTYMLPPGIVTPRA